MFGSTVLFEYFVREPNDFQSRGKSFVALDLPWISLESEFIIGSQVGWQWRPPILADDSIEFPDAQRVTARSEGGNFDQSDVGEREYAGDGWS
mmetsp:Transcript_30525/g.30842  ORF Transcript_30525/g.30842 Transcript_30525/m.30842 type:complete len:93 (+) Transcript_30525:389-667(+)